MRRRIGIRWGFGRDPEIGGDPSQVQIRDNEQRPWRKKDVIVLVAGTMRSDVDRGRSIGDDLFGAELRQKYVYILPMVSPKERTRMTGCMRENYVYASRRNSCKKLLDSINEKCSLRKKNEVEYRRKRSIKLEREALAVLLSYFPFRSRGGSWRAVRKGTNERPNDRPSE